MRVKYHLLASLAAALLYYSISGNIFASTICLVAGAVIDTDHLLDYYLIYGKFYLVKTLRGGFHKEKILCGSAFL